MQLVQIMHSVYGVQWAKASNLASGEAEGK
jgi:hypothetical protein